MRLGLMRKRLPLLIVPMLVVLAGSAPAQQARRASGLTLPAEDVSVADVVEWLAGATEKTVIPMRLSQLRAFKIDVWNGSPLDEQQLLTMMYRALMLNHVGIIETDDTIIVGTVQDITKVSEMPVVGVDDDLFDRPDRNTFITKFFRLEHADTGSVAAQLANALPEYASISYDEPSSLITFVGDLALARNIQLRIDELDQPRTDEASRIFRLQHAQAANIADRIADLFAPAQMQQQGSVRRRVRVTRHSVRATADQRTNSVIVVGDTSTIDLIAQLVEKEWDRPSDTRD